MKFTILIVLGFWGVSNPAVAKVVAPTKGPGPVRLAPATDPSESLASEPTERPGDIELQPAPTEDENFAKKATDKVHSAVLEIGAKADETRLRRTLANGFALINYSALDLLIPSKYGLTLGWIHHADKTWEFEYLHGSLSVPFLIKDLGKMSDDRYSLIARSYMGANSFNISYGISYFDFSVHLGNEYLDKVTGPNYRSSMDLVELEGMGFNVGFGNRWSLNKNITLGIDWISWAQPIFTTKRKSAFLDSAADESDRKDVEDGLGYIANFPRFSFLKLQLGILF